MDDPAHGPPPIQLPVERADSRPLLVRTTARGDGPSWPPVCGRSVGPPGDLGAEETLKRGER
jgi:hypothetical protein